MVILWVLISMDLYKTSYIFHCLHWIALLWRSSVLPWEACKIFNSLPFFCQRSDFNEMDYFRAWSIFLQWLCSCQNLNRNRKLLTFLSLEITSEQKDDWTHGKYFLKSSWPCHYFIHREKKKSKINFVKETGALYCFYKMTSGTEIMLSTKLMLRNTER